MKKYIITMLAGLFSFFGASSQEVPNSIYDVSAVTISGDTISMAEYKGKPLLIVNTASKCGFTPQFEGLEELHKAYADSGLVVLGFPCNQFMSQDPGSSEEIYSFCTKNYGVSFQMFEKIKVNGTDEHQLYTFLKSQQAGKIKWNFTKFLVDKNGVVVKRYGSSIKPSEIEADIKALL